MEVGLLLTARRWNGIDLDGAPRIFVNMHLCSHGFYAPDELGILIGGILHSFPGEDLVISRRDSLQFEGAVLVGSSFLI